MCWGLRCSVRFPFNKGLAAPSAGNAAPSGIALVAEGHLTKDCTPSWESPHTVTGEQKYRVLATHLGPTQDNSQGPLSFGDPNRVSRGCRWHCIALWPLPLPKPASSPSSHRALPKALRKILHAKCHLGMAFPGNPTQQHEKWQRRRKPKRSHKLS